MHDDADTDFEPIRSLTLLLSPMVFKYGCTGRREQILIRIVPPTSMDHGSTLSVSEIGKMAKQWTAKLGI